MPASREAGREAAGAAGASVRSEPVALVLVFASAHHDLPEVLRGVREVLGPAALIGATTAGEILDGDHRGSVVVVVVATREMEVHLGAAGGVAADWRSAVEAALAAPGVAPWFQGRERWSAATRAGRSVFALLFAPGNTRSAGSRAAEIADEVSRRAGGRLPLFGGCAADDWRMERNFVLAGDTVIEDGVAVAVVETSLQFGIAIAHPFHPTETEVVVTRADGPLAIELDGKPALQRFAELAGVTANGLEGEHLTLSTGLVLGAAGPYGDLQPTVASYATAAGAVRFTRALEPGTVLALLRASPDLARRTAVNAVQKAMLRGGIGEPVLALVACRAVRERLRHVAAQDEIPELVRLLHGTPLAGFRSFGEFGVTDAGAVHHASSVVSALVLGARLTQPALVARENEILRRQTEARALELSAANVELQAAQAELRATLDRLTHAQAQQQALFDHMTDLAWMKDGDGRYIAVNQAFAEFNGHRPEEMIGKLDVELATPGLGPDLRAEDREVLSTGAPRRFECRIIGADGQPVWLEKIKAPFRDGEERVVGTVGIARDIGARRELEDLRRRDQRALEELVAKRTAELSASEGRYRMLARGTPNSAVVVVDRDLSCTLAEGMLFDRLCIQPDRMMGRRVTDGPGHFAAFGPLLARALRGEAADVEVRFGKIVVALKAAPFRAADGTIQGAMMIVTDVTERWRLAEQVRQAQKMEAVGRLAGGVAHDFNNILTVILGAADEMIGKTSGADAQLHDLAQEVMEAALRAAALTRQLLAFSRGQPLRPRVMDVNEVLRGVEKLLRRVIGEDIDIATCLDPALGLVRADPGQIEQVLMNLVVNARDAMQHGGRLTIETSNVDHGAPDASSRVAPAPHVLIAVSDTGTGMAPEVLEHVFEPFFTTKERGRGTGLGLSTVFGIVKQSGGNISVYSEPGKGTTVKVYLPRIAGEVGAASGPGDLAAVVVRGTETVLVVEDDARVRAFMLRSLRAAGHDVLEAATPAEAEHLAREHPHPIGLLVSDVVMPGMDGPELAARLLGLRPDLRVLFVSGYTENAALRSGSLPPGQAFLPKPFTDSDLTRAARAVLDLGTNTDGTAGRRANA